VLHGIKAKRVIAGAALMLWVSLAPALARPADFPLSKDDVTLLLIGGATPGKIIALIEKRGVDFQMNPDLAKKFHDAGAPDAVIEALMKAGEKVTAVAPAATSPPEPSAAGSSQPKVELHHRSQSSVERKIAEALAPDERDYPPVPTFSLTDLNGHKLDFADYKGKVVLLDFWATWCRPCRDEIPEFVRLGNQYRDRGFQVIGIAVDDSPKAVREFYRDVNMNYPIALATPELRKLYGGIHSLPTTLLIGRDGRIYDSVEGAPADLHGFEQEIKMLLVSTGGDKTGLEQAASAAPAPAAAPAKAAGAAVDLSDPPADQVKRIIQEFAAKEKVFREARDNYTYHQINKIEELDADGGTVGMYEQDWDILYDDAGKRLEQVTYAPPDSLKGLIVTKEDLDSMRNVQPFVLTTDELPEYDIKYLGHVKVDEITAYVFSIRPKELVKGRQYFQGTVWVDDRDLQIVKSSGKPVPETRSHKGQFNLFPRFTTYREQIDGKFWFPTFTMADDTLYFPGMPVHMKEVIKYSDYKQFKSTSNIRMVKEIPLEPPKGSPKNEPAKKPPSKP
jgi:thiol-disulfide isomerase/thioredoxin